MEKRIGYDIFMSVKRVAQACNPFYVKRDKIMAKMKALAQQYKDYDTQISSLEAGIKAITGLRAEDLVKKVIEPATDENGIVKVDKEGKPIKVTKYVPTDIVTYDKVAKQYIITLPDATIPVEGNNASEEEVQTTSNKEEQQQEENLFD